MTNVTLTTEQAQQIEEALEDIVRVFEFETGTPVEALATIRASRAQANTRSSSRSASEYSEQAEQTNTQLIEGYRIGLAEMREKCARLCENRLDYYGVGYAHGLVTEKLAEAIRAIKFEGDTGFRSVSEMIAEEEPVKQEPVTVLKPWSYGGTTGIHDYLMSDGSIRALTPDEARAINAAPVKPVKQEPVAVISESAIGLIKLHSNGVCLPFGTQLYAAPVSVEAIRSEALEEAAELCDRFAKRQMHPAECAAAIRKLK